jgi:hypothetical protein
MIGGDPNLVNPQNRQGYGRNVQTQLIPQPKTTPASKPTTPTVVDSMGEQSIQAVLQLGVLVRFCPLQTFPQLFFLVQNLVDKGELIVSWRHPGFWLDLWVLGLLRDRYLFRR